MKLRKFILPAGALAAVLAARYYKRRVVTPVIADFDVWRYMGLWYEAASTGEGFGRGLDFFTVHYQMNGDGTVKVTGRGYNRSLGIWEQNVGEARPDRFINHFKLYFNPMIGMPYRVAYVDADYSVAVVVGKSLRYAWILSRSPYIGSEKLETALSVLASMGYGNRKMIFPVQADSPATGQGVGLG